MKKIPVETVAIKWIELKAKAKEIDKELAELKPILEAALKESSEKFSEWNGWRFSLVEFVKESFNLGKAKEKIDGRKLAPFITETNVVQIRTSWQGGEKEDAA